MTDGKDPGRRPATPVSRTPRVLGGVLALAACLQAGLDGIEKNIPLPPCVEGNMFEMEP